MDNNFQTPGDVIKYMIKMIPLGTKIILEPAPGEGNIVKQLDIGKYEMIHAPADFFLWEKRRVDCIIMNPPFSSKYANLENAKNVNKIKGMRLGYFFLTECMELSDEVIALMPSFTISDSDVRARYLYSWGLKSYTVLPRKTFQYTRIQTVILQLSKGFKGKTIFKLYDLL